MGAFVGRPRKHAYADKLGQLAIEDSDFENVPIEPKETKMTSLREAYAHLGEGDNTRYIQVIIETHKIAQDANENDISTLYDCLNRYIEMCRDYDVKLTNMGAYQACGLSRDKVDYWASGKRRSNDPEYARFAQLIRAVCSEYREIVMAEGKLNPVTGIWWQKNYDRFQDSPAPFLEAADEDDSQTSSEIAAKYENLPDE